MDEWTVPAYSRTQVDKAGRDLVAEGPLGLKRYLEVRKLVNNWRSAHA